MEFPPDSTRVRQAEWKRTRFTGFPQGLTLLLGDALTLLFAHILAQHLIKDSLPHSLTTTLIWGGVWLVWRAYQGLYPGYGCSPQTELRQHVLSTVQICVIQLVAAVTFLHLFSGGANVVLMWMLTALLALPLRYGLRAQMIHLGNYGRQVSVIGAGSTAHQLITHLHLHPEYGLKPVVAYDDNAALHGTTIDGVKVLGGIDQALYNPQTEHALVSIPGARAEQMQRLVNRTHETFPNTWVIPDLFGIPNQALRTHNIGSIASLELSNNLKSWQTRFLKRTIDVVCAGIGGLLILPLLLLIVAMIKLDSPGPAVYRARRLGRDGQMFDCLKFRSMHQDADKKLNDVLEADSKLKAEFEETHKLRNDPRITRVGQFLRKTSLDELPQLWNVINGTMSLVGPRPIVEAEIVKYGEIFEVYKQVRPGITGYWQANGRSDTTYGERVGMDYFYITNWSPWLDAIILIRTIGVVLKNEGAY